MFPEFRKFETTLAGRPLVVETGKMAGLAGGSCLIRYGETEVLCTATMAAKPREGVDFFPLSVDFEEKLYSVGRIPGSFQRREGKASEKATLSSRVIDRPIRPLFPKDMRNDVGVVATVMSVDQDCLPEITAMIGVSVAISISEIPWDGPISGVSVGLVDGEFVINPTEAQRAKSDMAVTVASTADLVAMIEAGADVNITDKKGRTPLMYCVSYDNETCVKTLISAGANIKAKSLFGYKVIDYAKKVDMFEYLIEAGAKFDIKDYHDSLLVHYALREDNEEMIKAIFSKTKNINRIMGDGRTVLSDAVLWSSYYNFTNDVNFYISELIDMGANPKVKDKSGYIAMNYFDYEWNDGAISMWRNLIDDMDELDLYFDIRYKRRPESRLLAKAEARKAADEGIYYNRKNELLNLFLDEKDGDYYSEHYFECVDSCCINDRYAPCIHGDFDDENNHVPICNDDCETMKFVLQEASGKSAKK